MRVDVTEIPSFSQPIVGNVYSCNGGYGRKAGHAMVLIAITESGNALMLVIDSKGNPVGVTSYGIHAIEERAPIAFVRGLEEMTLKMEPV
jgi:hypothetical protein